MPENFIKTLNSLPPHVGGVLMAMFISVLRVLYDGREARPMRMILEALICGALSLSVSYAIMAMQLDMEWAVFAGGVIGYFGSTGVRQIALRIIRKKID